MLVGFHRKDTGLPSMTWTESVREALCFGWIDGIRKRVDATRYTIRFTPRKPGSIWSAVNVKHVEELSAAGLMQPAGLRAYEREVGGVFVRAGRGGAAAGVRRHLQETEKGVGVVRGQRAKLLQGGHVVGG